eukprot:2303507-Rhodomonas_salina.1
MRGARQLGRGGMRLLPSELSPTRPFACCALRHAALLLCRLPAAEGCCAGLTGQAMRTAHALGRCSPRIRRGALWRLKFLARVVASSYGAMRGAALRWAARRVLLAAMTRVPSGSVPLPASRLLCDARADMPRAASI